MNFWQPKNKSVDSDAELVMKYRTSHDTKYVGELFTRYTTLVFGICMKYLKDEDSAKDAVMQIFENLISLLKKHQVENFKPWLHTLTRNHCLMELRKKGMLTELNDDYKGENQEGDMELNGFFHLDDKKGKEKLLNDLEKAMVGLKEEQKCCIELFYLKDKSYTEIVEITGFDIKQVKSYIQNGKRNLKIIMEQDAK
jgi:RNA polymerase sigma-70 factor (ECF subfamily)